MRLCVVTVGSLGRAESSTPLPPSNDGDVQPAVAYPSQERQTYLLQLERLGLKEGPSPSLTSSLFGPAVFVALVIAFFVWASHAPAASVGDRLAPGTYPFDLSIGGFVVTSVQVEPTNAVMLSGVYQNSTNQTVTVSCKSQPGGNITFSDGTSLDGIYHSCVGHEGEKVSVAPGKEIVQYLEFPPSDDFAAGAPIRFSWDTTQWSLDLPSTRLGS
jgi:hypothetical protein